MLNKKHVLSRDYNIKIIIRQSKHALENAYELFLNYFCPVYFRHVNSTTIKEATNNFKYYLKQCNENIQRLDCFIYRDSKMNIRFNNLHYKIIQNLQETIKECGSQNIPIQDVPFFALNEKEDILIFNKEKKLLEEYLLQHSIQKQVKPVIQESYYLERVITELKAKKDLVDKIIMTKQIISDDDLQKIMDDYFKTAYSLIPVVRRKRIRQCIDFLAEFYRFYFGEELAELDCAKDLNLKIPKLKYLPNKSPYDTFEQVIDNPNGSFSLNYDVNDLSWS